MARGTETQEGEFATLEDVSQSEVAGATGIAVSTISEVLRGKRTLNRAQIGKMAAASTCPAARS